MPDDKSKAGGQDRRRINVDEDYELRDWSKKFGVTQEELKAAVRSVGDQHAEEVGRRRRSAGALSSIPQGAMRSRASVHCARPPHMPQRSAAVCTGASHSCFNSLVSMQTVMEQPAISREVT